MLLRDGAGLTDGTTFAIATRRLEEGFGSEVVGIETIRR
jgi:hypothetical protein